MSTGRSTTSVDEFRLHVGAGVVQDILFRPENRRMLPSQFRYEISTPLMTLPERLRTWADNAVPALACMILLQAQAIPLQAHSASRAGTEARPHPAQRRLQSFVETLRSEGAIEKLEPCRYGDACLTVTPMFARFTNQDKAAIGGLIRRCIATSPLAGEPVASVRFIDAETGRELGEYREHRLIWRNGSAPPASGQSG